MSLVFSKAKNGMPICSCNGIFLHSTYNPLREAERFVNLSSCSFIPSSVCIVEPALSYCFKFLRGKFPFSQLSVIRLSHDFDAYNDGWDHIFYCCSCEDLSEQLFDMLGENGIMTTFFISWDSSEKAFPVFFSQAWTEIKKAVIKSRTVLETRTYFTARWLKNLCVFFKNIRKTAVIKTGTSPILITASGPSLADAVPFIKKFRTSFFLIAVSSSLDVLFYHQIIPDLCISTDGGFWAKKHLETLRKYTTLLPLALSPEAACSPQLLSDVAIVPLSYGSEIEKSFFSSFGITAHSARRNGTVSGTAVELALSLTSGPVFCCGLDLSPGKGYQHTQPNRLEMENCSADNRLKTKETRSAASEFLSTSLAIYRSWFSSRGTAMTSRLFRLSDNFPFTTKLGTIKDVDWNFFLEHSNPKCIPPEILISDIKEYDDRNRCNKIKTTLDSLKTGNVWLENAFPTDFISYLRSGTTEQKNIYKERLDKKNAELIKKLEDLVCV